MQICQKTDTEPNIHQPVVDPWGWVDHPFREKKNVYFMLKEGHK